MVVDDEPVVKLSLICEPRPYFVKIADEDGIGETRPRGRPGSMATFEGKYISRGEKALRQETEIRVFHARGSAETGEFDRYGRAANNLPEPRWKRFH